MSRRSGHRFVMTNSVANRVLIPLLKSPAGRLLGRRLALVEYVGRRTGQRHRLVAGYVTEARTVRIGVGMAEQKTWWRNFLTPRSIRLRLAGHEYEALARVVRGDEVSVVVDLDGNPLPTDH